METLFPLAELRSTIIESTGTEAFRPIHYLGSKLRMLDFIEKNLNIIDSHKGHICDLFAGSGSVSYKFSKSRPVTSVDIQEYSRIICSSLLNPSSPDITFIKSFLNDCRNSAHTKRLFDAVNHLTYYEDNCIKKALIEHDLVPLCEIIENGSIISLQKTNVQGRRNPLAENITQCLNNLILINIEEVDSLILRYYGGIYFSYKQATQIDCILYQIANSPAEYRDCLLAALISTVSDSVNTVGKQFAQPLRPKNTDGKIKPSLGKMAAKDRYTDIFLVFEKWLKKYAEILPSSFKNRVLRMDYSAALDILDNDVEIVYADPPYTRDHYSRFYHVLETISLRDMPELSKMKLKGKEVISRGLYRVERHQSPFCIKNQALEAFNQLFLKSSKKGAKVLLSYSKYNETAEAHPRVVTIKQLTDIALKYFRHVECVSTGNFIHSKLNHSSKHLSASEDAEQLIICT